MTSRERLQTVLRGGIPDCVPVTPDFSNMIPARMTGKPFWDIYLYNDPPIWEAFLDCAKYFNIDCLMDFPLAFPEETNPSDPEWEKFIIFENDEEIITQASYVENGKRKWASKIDVYYISNPPTTLSPETIGLPKEPTKWRPVEGVKSVDVGPEGFKRMKRLLGDQGILGVGVTSTCCLGSVEDIYDYYDNPEKYVKWGQDKIKTAEDRFKRVMSMDVKPDWIGLGGSGSLVFQTVEIFRQVAFPAVKRAIELAHDAGVPSHVHSCGPEKELVKIMAEETDLTVIDPLEIPPMGDCNLKELKTLYGNKIVLKGNLHTTEVMLRGSAADVIAASKKAIDDAAAGGKFILSTGDQCGRDTPDENLRAMIDTAREYGRYK